MIRRVLLLIVFCSTPLLAIDSFVNFGLVTVSTGYDDLATSIVVSSGEGASLPTGTFNLVWWNATDYGSATSDPNREIIRCSRSVDTLTCVRAQEGTTAHTHNTSGKVYKLDATITAKTMTELALSTDGSHFNYFWGHQAGNVFAGGDNNTGGGYAALHGLTTGTNNTALGYAALLGDTDGANNVAVGVNACATNTSGFSLTCLGYNAGAANTNGESNVFVGSRAGESNTTADFNVYVGSFAGQIDLGQANTYLGYKSGFVSTDGNRNTYVGNSAGFTATNGTDNTVLGYNAGNGLTTGDANTIIGANVTGVTPNLTNGVILADGAGNIRFFASAAARIAISGAATNPAQLAVTQTTAPTCTSNCGTSPSVVGSDSSMLVTMGATGSPASAWVVTFNGTWDAAPSCVVQMAKAGMAATHLALTAVASTTILTVVTNGAAPSNGDVYAIHCLGVQ